MSSQSQATRSSWKGSITFGMVSVPVKLYTATEQRKVAFNMVHGECATRTRSQTQCPTCERDVERSEVVKGYDTGDGYVLLTDDDFDGLPLRSTRAVEVIAFIPSDMVPRVMLDKPYFVGPDGDTGQKAYQLLESAMSLVEGGLVAVAKIARSGRESICIIEPYDTGVMALYQLVWPDEVRAVEAIQTGIDQTIEISDEERLLAQELVQAMSQPDAAVLFEQEDDYRKALMSVIEAKQEGREPAKLPKAEKKAGPVMLDALRASVQAAKKAA